MQKEIFFRLIIDIHKELKYSNYENQIFIIKMQKRNLFWTNHTNAQIMKYSIAKCDAYLTILSMTMMQSYESCADWIERVKGK